MACPVGVDELPWFGQEFIGVSPKVVPLSLESGRRGWSGDSGGPHPWRPPGYRFPRPHLDQVGRQHLVPVPIVEGKRRGEAGHGDARLDARAHCPPPGLLPRAKPPGKVTGPIEMTDFHPPQTAGWKTDAPE